MGMDLSIKMKKTGTIALLALLALGTAFSAFAQTNRKQPDTDICVIQNPRTDDEIEAGCRTTIQAAINAAQPGMIIEILDTAIYAEQVTIDGRDGPSPWPGVTSGKNGITLRYVPRTNAAFSNHARPTIRWRDTENNHPRNNQEARQESELTGAGNFETNGALRVLRAKGITIEGITVDGVSAYAFGYANVWCDANGGNCNELVHGSAAITLAVAGRVTIRDCILKNAYFGINVKDRNTGGVFGNPNPSDNDATVPLSGFGNVGGHLFEYNRIHDNSVGVFFESAWDLGSSVRYNLIYNNTQKASVASLPKADNINAGAFMFKDNYLTPIAIYNNTLYDNTGNFNGHWQVGGQHLIFNNIFSRQNPSANPGYQHMAMDSKFPFRMNNCVFSAPAVYRDGNGIRGQYQSNFNCSNAMAPGGSFVSAVQLPGFTALAGRMVTLNVCNTPGTQSGTQQQSIVTPGTSITGLTQPATAIPTNAELRWLQTEGATVTEGIQGGSLTLAPLFRSMTATSTDFLVPDWGVEAVDDYIKNKGWTLAGMRNSDGQPADLGAIPSSGGRLTTVARIIPTNVVMINTAGTTGSANFRLLVEKGTFNNPKIKMLRWIAPVPPNCQNQNAVQAAAGCNGNDWPSDLVPVPSTSIHNITTGLPNVQVGNNSGLTFNTGATGAAPRYGFFEIIIEGTDAAGNAVTSDVGFLPYRQLEYIIDIKVRTSSGTTGPALATVKAGEPYWVTFTPQRRDGGSLTTGLNEATYSLLSEPPTWMRYVAGDAPLTGDVNVPATGKPYQVYFTQAGDETISAAGVYAQGNTRLVFLGTLDIKVDPGAPYRAVFTNPLPERLLLGAPAPTISKGGAGLQVAIEVQDKFGNKTNEPNVPIALSSLSPNKGSIEPATASTVGTTGEATARAFVTEGVQRDTFRLLANYVAGAGAPDTLLLRVGRTLDELRIFYGDAGAATNARADQSVVIDTMFGAWAQVTVKVIEADTVQATRTQAITVERSDPPVAGAVAPPGGFEGLIFATTPGGTPTNTFTLTNGIAVFWVSADPAWTSSIDGAEIVVKTADIGDTRRGNISFKKPETGVLRAEVFGNGDGRPDSIVVYYNTGGGNGLTGGDIELPANIALRWPSLTDDPVTIPVTSSMVSSDSVLSVQIPSAVLALLPTGFTEPAGNRGLVVLNYAAGSLLETNGDFDVIDKIGPVISSGDDMSKAAFGISPVIVENLTPRTTPDVIRVTISEGITDEVHLRQLMYSADGAGNGVALTVTGVEFGGGRTYIVTITPGADGVVPVEGGYIKIGSSSQLTDAAGNGVRADNRWVRLVGEQVAPGYTEAWYTSDPRTGRPDVATVTFNKTANFVQWFGSAGASVRIGGTNVTANVTDYMTSEGFTLKIDLSVAVPALGGPSAPIKTSGIIDIVFGFATSASGTDEKWDNLPVMAQDKAAPVLAQEAELRMGDLMEDERFAMDTLIVVYSERMSDQAESALTGAQQPVVIELWRSGGATTCIPVLRDAVATDVPGTSFRRITYLVETLPCEVQLKGDSIRINVPANLADREGNVQVSAANLAQPLKVKPSPIKWTVKVKNNPGRAGNGRPTEIVLSPNTKVGTIKTDAKFIIFDNMGSVVMSDSAKFGQNLGDPKDVTWTWNGYNQKGRQAGTGAYMLKVICDAQEFGEDRVTPVGLKQKSITTRTIGLIRGVAK